MWWLPHFAAAFASAPPNRTAESPADHLPPHITQVTWFGERADWSHDGKKILFLSKTFGDALEIDLQTKRIRNLTAHYPHPGYTRALYLANGDILLSGPEAFDPKRVGEARVQCFLSVLDKSLSKPVNHWHEVQRRSSRLAQADAHRLTTSQGIRARCPWAARAYKRTSLRGRPAEAGELAAHHRQPDLPFKCTLETQNYRPPDEKELTFSAYGHQGTDVGGVNLTTKKVTNYSNSPGQYDEPEGIYPDGQYTLVECDKQNLKGPGFVDLWKLKLDGSGTYERLTHFSDYPGYKASNPVVSDDGRFIAFQMSKSREAAGVGHGLFIYESKRRNHSHRTSDFFPAQSLSAVAA